MEPGEDTSNVNCWMDIRKGRFPEVRMNRYETKIKSAAIYVDTRKRFFWGVEMKHKSQLLD